ncbi:ABC transporter permease [Pseudaminobacter sp. NGMCC 1.201702]|uniref:ABC transporter permease n=1 Tax=Pseudaminobacter sp. NGMCC 1.201702 TaxID=3391825 RepID=UPI0039F122CE
MHHSQTSLQLVNKIFDKRVISAGLFILTVFAYAIILLPIIVIIISSFNPSSALVFPPRALSLRWYFEFFATGDMVAGLKWSVIIAIVSSAVSVVLGTLAAIALVRGRFPLRGAINALLLTPLIFPGLILGVALLLYFQTLDLPLLARVAAAHILLGIPFVVRSVISSLDLFDMRIEEAAIIHGAFPARAFFKVTLPSIQPGIVAGAIFAFVVSFGEINATLFLSGPGLSTLPVQIYSQIQYGSEQVVVAAASTVQMVLVVLLVFVLEKIFGLSVTTAT